MPFPSALTFDSGKPGPSLLVLGAVHGDETCGPDAIRALADAIASGRTRLRAGRLTMVPVCNPRAYALGVRYVEKNLNRVFRENPAPSCYEERLANALVPLVAKCDYLLDLHSMSSGEAPFVFQDGSDFATAEFALAPGAPYVVTGWPQMYASTTDSDTVGYARSLGKVGAVVECGRHGDPAAVAAATKAIRGVLSVFGMTETVSYPVVSVSRVRAERIYRKERPGELSKAWKNFDPVAAGEEIATYADGEVLRAPADGVVLLPFAAAKPADEWFYFGRSEPAA